jgi:hypothetical protein
MLKPGGFSKMHQVAGKATLDDFYRLRKPIQRRNQKQWRRANLEAPTVKLPDEIAAASSHV